MSREADLPASTVRQFKETRLGMTQGKITAEVTYTCAAADLPAMLKALGGVPEVINGNVRVIPLQYPDFSYSLPLYADQVDAEGIGHNGLASPNGFYSRFKVKVHFSTFPYSFDGSAALQTVDLAESSRQMVGSPSSFAFSGGSRPTLDVPVTISGFQARVTLYRLPVLNFASYQSLSNCVNTSTFLGYPRGTVLYRGPASNSSINVAGQVSHQITHVFDVSAVDWNYELKPGSTAFFALFYADVTTYRYTYTSLDSLLA